MNRGISPTLLLILILIACVFTSVFANEPCGECHNGTCHDGKCMCRYHWVGDTCDSSIWEHVPEFYLFLTIFFSVLFFTLLAVTILIMFHTIKSNAAYYHRIGFGLIAFDCIVQVAIYTSKIETIEGRPALYTTGIITMLHFNLIYITYCVYLTRWIALNARYKRMARGMRLGVNRISSSSYSGRSGTSVSHSSVSVSCSVGIDSFSSRASIDDEFPSSVVLAIAAPTITPPTTPPTTPTTPPTTPPITPRDSETSSTPAATIRYVNENSSTALVHESMEVKDGEDGEERNALSKWWNSFVSGGVTGKKLKRILWFASFIVTFGNGIRMAIYEVDIPMWIGPFIYAFMSISAWFLIMAGFDLYKRSFLRKLRISEQEKHEVVSSLHKVSRTTYLVVLVLLIWASLAFLQSIWVTRSFAIIVFTLRGVVTACSICLYIDCFGSLAAKRLIALAKARFNALYHK